MQIIKSVITLAVFFFPLFIIAQTTYLPEGAKELHLIDRMEIKQGENTDLNFSSVKPYSRKAIVREAEYIDSLSRGYHESLTGNDNGEKAANRLTSVDKYNLHSLLMNNSEWVTGDKESFLSKRPVLKSFYVTKPNLLEVNTPDFFLAVNPVLNFQMGG